MQDGFMSVDVQRLDHSFLAQASRNSGIVPDDLPRSFVSFPPRDPSRVAVLSWRWDLEPISNASRNILAALLHAKQVGLHHVFLDLVSINQRLTGDKLAEAVIEFSRLFESLPVIAAYDELNASDRMFIRTMRRPWIAREVRSWRANPSKVVYVGHTQSGGCARFSGTETLFEHMVDRLWWGTYANSILYLLGGQTNMTAISDFRYIMHEHAIPLAAACARMSRNDYLLTAAILAQNPSYTDDDRVNDDQDPSHLQYERYTLVNSVGGSFDDTKSILLDGNKVATWRVHNNLYMAHIVNHFSADPDAERTIFESLGLSDSEYQYYASRERQRRDTMIIAAKKETRIPGPTFQAVSVTL